MQSRDRKLAMDSRIITEQQSEALNTLLNDMLVETEAESIFVCDCGGNIFDYVSGH